FGGFERILQHVRAEAIGIADDFQRFTRAQLPLESEQAAVAVHEVQRFTRAQIIQRVLEPREVANGGEIGEIELQAAENAVERVVARNDDLDGGGAEIDREQRRLSREGRGRGRGRCNRLGAGFWNELRRRSGSGRVGRGLEPGPRQQGASAQLQKAYAGDTACGKRPLQAHFASVSPVRSGPKLATVPEPQSRGQFGARRTKTCVNKERPSSGSTPNDPGLRRRGKKPFENRGRSAAAPPAKKTMTER